MTFMRDPYSCSDFATSVQVVSESFSLTVRIGNRTIAPVQLRLALCAVARRNDGFATMKYPQGGTLTPTPTPTATPCRLACVEQVPVPYLAFGMFVANASGAKRESIPFACLFMGAFAVSLPKSHHSSVATAILMGSSLLGSTTFPSL
jgi:hypothetical protein